MATVAKRSRQQRVLEVLEKQLKNGVKTEKGTMNTKIPLTDSDKKRIEREINNLKTKV
jgi:NAD(P)H-dependent FMN reductase